MGHESQIEPWSPLDQRSALLVSELTGFVAKQAMKTSGKENQNSCATTPSNRAHGAAGQNRSCSMKWAAKVEKFRPRERFFFLTFPFIEQTRSRDSEEVARLDISQASAGS
jgi:hypothetical protein